MNTSLLARMAGGLLVVLLVCGLGMQTKAQQADAIELDARIQQLQSAGDEVGAENLRGLYYDLHPTVFIKAEDATPVTAGRGRVKVANVHVSQFQGLSMVDVSAVRLLILSFEGLQQAGGYRFSEADLEAFTALEYIVVLSEANVSASTIQAMFPQTGESSRFTILHKSLTEEF